jgi:hypothetical protein
MQPARTPSVRMMRTASVQHMRSSAKSSGY